MTPPAARCRVASAFAPELTPSWHPILFSGAMVRAILDGRKTQTRRVIRPQPWTSAKDHRWISPGQVDEPEVHGVKVGEWSCFVQHNVGDYGGPPSEWAVDLSLRCPYGQPGDMLWVRETWALAIPAGASIHAERVFHYRADGHTLPRWRPSIYMPRQASRISLRVTDVRVERVQDISDEDARAEGIEAVFPDIQKRDLVGSALASRNAFEELWDSINARRGFGWDVNPWVWCISFERVEAHGGRGVGR